MRANRTVWAAVVLIGLLASPASAQSPSTGYQNAAALERFQSRRKEDLSDSLKRENILKRFLRFLHH